MSKFISLTVSEFFLRGSKFIFFLVLTNFYSQNVVYEYGYFTALFSIFFVFSDLGFQAYLTKELSSKSSLSNHLMGINTAIFRVLFFVFIGFFIIFFYMFSSKEFFVYIFLLFLVDAILAMSFAFYRAKDNQKKEIILKFIVGSIFLFISLLGYFSLDVSFLFFLLCFSLLVYTLYDAVFFQKKYFTYFFKKFSFSTYIVHIKKSIFIFAGALATIGYLRIDILMLEWFGFEEGVVYYTIASRVLELSLIIPAMISAVLLPKFVKTININHKKDIFLQFLIGLFVMIVFLIISSFLIALLFPKYLESVSILNILLLAIPFMLVSNYGFTYFVAKDLSKIYFIIALIMFLVNAVLNSIFIPTYGYEAAAWTTLLTEFIGVLLALILFKKLIHT